VCLSIVLLFGAYVIGEVASIAILGSYLGAGYTLLVIGLGVMLGVMLLAGRAFSTLQNAAEAWSKGEEIGPIVASSALVGLAGILFLLPGLLSDAAAIALLVPPVRGRMSRNLVGRVKAHAVRLHPRGPGGPSAKDEYIDAEGVERPGDPPPSLP
jgi:UPF0716 protein FxsA